MKATRAAPDPETRGIGSGAAKSYQAMGSVVDQARAAGVALVRVAYCDNANLVRAKAVPLHALDDVLRYGVGFTVAQQALPIMADTVLPASGFAPVGEVWLVPDPATFTGLRYAARRLRDGGGDAVGALPARLPAARRRGGRRGRPRDPRGVRTRILL